MPNPINSPLQQTPHDDIRRLGMRLQPLFVAFNAGFALLFGLLHVWPLTLSYLACLLFFLWLHRKTSAPDYQPGPLLAWVWVVVFLQALLAVAMIGPAAGFQFYLLSTIQPGFSSSQRSLASKVFQTVVIIVFFIVCDVWIDPTRVLYNHLSVGTLAFLRHLNIVGGAALLAGVAYTHARSVQEAENALIRIASTDALTGLFNRRRIAEIAEREIARSQRNARPVSVVLCDIDHFKHINDTWGHPAGDHVLQIIARLLQDAVREYDCVARWGGEEFLLLLPDTPRETAAAIAERVRAKVADARVSFEDQPIPVAMTLGVAQISGETDWQAAIARADEALYRGKEGGRNRVELG